MAVRILIVHASDYTNYYDASTPEKLAQNALGVLTYFFKERGAYQPVGDEPQRPQTLPSVEEIKAMADPDLRKLATHKHNQWARELRSWKTRKRMYEDVQRVVEGQLATEAWRCLDQWSDYCGERIELETAGDFE